MSYETWLKSLALFPKCLARHKMLSTICVIFFINNSHFLRFMSDATGYIRAIQQDAFEQYVHSVCLTTKILKNKDTRTPDAKPDTFCHMLRYTRLLQDVLIWSWNDASASQYLCRCTMRIPYSIFAASIRVPHMPGATRVS
jgi:hypothetical protein